MSKDMKKLILVAILSALASCGTVEGIGNDISDSARAVRNWF